MIWYLFDKVDIADLYFRSDPSSVSIFHKLLRHNAHSRALIRDLIKWVSGFIFTLHFVHLFIVKIHFWFQNPVILIFFLKCSRPCTYWIITAGGPYKEYDILITLVALIFSLVAFEANLHFVRITWNVEVQIKVGKYIAFWEVYNVFTLPLCGEPLI